MHIQVYVKFTVSVPYMIDVEDPRNVEQIRAALKGKDPSDWVTDPNFHENFGSNWTYFIDNTNDFAPSCPKCGHKVEPVSLSSKYVILGCPEHREFDKTFPL